VENHAAAALPALSLYKNTLGSANEPSVLYRKYEKDFALGVLTSL
jgi:hypothetical protein